MPEAKCGFNDGDGHKGRDLLVHYGPTLLVDIGFDPKYNPQNSPEPPTAAIQQVHAIIDTGATISCIDKTTAGQLQLPVVDRQNFGGIDGAYVAEMHAAQIHIPSLSYTIYGSFAGVDLIGGGQQHVALIGRTFLRNFRMIYDGTTGDVTISRP